MNPCISEPAEGFDGCEALESFCTVEWAAHKPAHAYPPDVPYLWGTG